MLNGLKTLEKVPFSFNSCCAFRAYLYPNFFFRLVLALWGAEAKIMPTNLRFQWLSLTERVLFGKPHGWVVFQALMPKASLTEI